MSESETTTRETPEAGSAEEELYEWIWDKVQNKWVKITPSNSEGRLCGRCGCSCPCSCADCLYQCCS